MDIPPLSKYSCKKRGNNKFMHICHVPVIHIIISHMKYLICSDLHGDEKTFERLIKIKDGLKCDGIISAGDFCPTMSMEVSAYNIEFKTVMGNCDRYHTYSLLPTPKDFIIFDYLSHKVVVTHGDCYIPSYFNLKQGDIFISGHTHIGHLGKEDGIILFNPGSPSRPRDGRRSFGILSEEGIRLLTLPFLRTVEVLSF